MPVSESEFLARLSFSVDESGNIFEGRKDSMTALIRGAHAGCGNTDTFGFTFLDYIQTGMPDAIKPSEFLIL